MRKFFAPVTLVLLLAACNNENTANPPQSNDTTEVEEPVVDVSRQEIANAFPDAYQFFNQQDSTFNAGRFEETTSDTIHTPALKLSNTLKSYAPYFIYNADSSYAVDLYSYNILFVKRNGKTVAEAGGPDTEVGLIDLKNKTRKRIYFGGASSAVMDAKWINNTQFLLLTGEIINDTKFQPQLIKYTVSDSVETDFVYDDTLQVKVSDYRDKRLGNL